MSFRTVFQITCIAFLSLSACNNTAKQKDQTKVEHLSFADGNAGLVLPEGFKAVLVAEKIGAARHIAIRDNGDMYVALNAPHDDKVIAALRDTTGDGIADEIAYFGSNLLRGTGMRIYKNYLYFGSDTAIVRFKLKDGSLLPDLNMEQIASLPVQNVHEAKSLAFDVDGNVYVNVGAPSNACQVEDRTKGSPAQNPCPLLEHHAAIWKFDADKLNQSQQNGGERYVTGIRNCVALDWDPESRNLYAVMHGRDQLHQLFPDLYDEKQGADLPAEEFLKFKEGGNYGWPYSYWDQHKNQFIQAPEYGGDGQKVAEGNYEAPILGFPGHLAPNGLHFYNGKQFPDKYKHGAFIAFHGSWNRAPEPQRGFNLTFVPFQNGKPGEPEVFADNFSGTSAPMQSPGEAAHRPSGVSEGPDGSLYVTDDAGGAIFRIVYTGE